MTGLSRAHTLGKIAKLGVPLRLGGKMKAEDTIKSSKEHQNQDLKRTGARRGLHLRFELTYRKERNKNVRVRRARILKIHHNNIG